MTTPSSQFGHEESGRRPHFFGPRPNAEILGSHPSRSGQSEQALDDETYWSKICERATD